MEDIIVNKVAESDIQTLDLEKYFPAGEVMVFDLKDRLYKELILKEKDYRENLKNIDWSVYWDKYVSLICPHWNYCISRACKGKILIGLSTGINMFPLHARLMQ